MPGMRQSLITRSMSSCSSTLSACRPLPAVNTWTPFWLRADDNRSQSLGSSSTTNMLCVMSVLVVFADCRNVQAERSAGIILADAFDAAVVTFHDRIDFGQAQAGAGGLGGDERGEDALDHIRRDTLAGVGDADDCVVAHRTNAQGQAATFGHCIDSVENQVEAGLFELLGVGIDGRARRLVVDVGGAFVAGRVRAAEAEDLLHQRARRWGYGQP